MTAQQMQLDGYLITEKEIQRLEDLILTQYRAAQQVIDSKLKALFADMSNLDPKERYNWLIQYDRLGKLKREIQDIYALYDTRAYKNTVQSGKLAMSNSYYRQFYSLSWMEPLSFTILPENLIEYAVTGQITAWNELSKTVKDRMLNPSIWPPKGTLLETFLKNRADTVLKIQQQINGGVMAGDSYATIARRISDTFGKTYQDRMTGQLAKSARIVRTEGQRLMNSGSFSASLTARAQGIDIKKVWDATLDSATRPAHGAADEQVRELEEHFLVGGEELMFPGDSSGSAGNIIHCRCVKADRVGDWKPTARRGKNPATGKYELMDYKSFMSWANEKGLTMNKYGQLYKSS